MGENYFVIGTTRLGCIYYYTGRAGVGWVSTNREEAFSSYSEEEAKHKAELFNGRKNFTGIIFTVGRTGEHTSWVMLAELWKRD
jgi:hypothetical protein